MTSPHISVSRQGGRISSSHFVEMAAWGSNLSTSFYALEKTTPGPPEQLKQPERLARLAYFSGSNFALNRVV
ncbi:hypothetical protein OUZ56_013810 [Daphnia magna]|uniref:Uncharacterized protein n=1 Tax=Daphnia magna TaxID=35525 RepID=A0ABQ9Z702_9CRUS|nr:hypothetical protein OUZ56_013810 [Daphnia magna]